MHSGGRVTPDFECSLLQIIVSIPFGPRTGTTSQMGGHTDWHLPSGAKTPPADPVLEEGCTRHQTAPGESSPPSGHAAEA